MQPLPMASNATNELVPSDKLAIHALSHRIVARVVAFLLAAFALGQLVFAVLEFLHGGALLVLLWWPQLICGVIFLVVRHMLSGSQPVFATRSGLQFGSGVCAHLVPWARVQQVTAVARYNVSTSIWSRVYQVELTSGAPLRFVGRKDALARIARLRL